VAFSAPNSFLAGVLPWTPLEQLTAFPRPPSWFKGLYFYGKGGGKWKGEQKVEMERKGTEGTVTQIAGSAPVMGILYVTDTSVYVFS